MEEFLGYVFGDLTLSYMLAFYLFSFIGMAFTFVMHYQNKKAKQKKKSKAMRFKFGYFFRDNWARWTTNILAVFILLRFHNYFTQQELNMFLGLVSGLSIDLVIIAIRKYTNVSWFQSATKKSQE